jgi:hypothetical protein
VEQNPAGWYQDPTNPLQEKLWDGEEWLDRVRPRKPDGEQRADDQGRTPAPTPTYTPPPTLTPTSDPVSPDVPSSSLRDLLNSPVPAPPPVVTAPSRVRRPRRWAVVGVVALVVAAVGGFAGLRADQYRRQQEMRSMLELIEESESTMHEWMANMEPVYAEAERACSTSQEACDALGADELYWERVRNAAREAARSLETIAGQFSASKGLRIMAWHGDVIRARDSYLDHNAAWVRYLEAVGRNTDELFTDTVNNDDIEPTFAAACRSLRRVGESSMYPKLSSSNKARVETICVEE